MADSETPYQQVLQQIEKHNAIRQQTCLNSSDVCDSNTRPAGIYVAAAATLQLSARYVCCIGYVGLLADKVAQS